MSNSLAAVHPELVAEWSEKNLPLTPDSISFGSNKKVWWKGACGHEWQTSVKARSNGEKCPICSGARVIAGINDLATLEMCIRDRNMGCPVPKIVNNGEGSALMKNPERAKEVLTAMVKAVKTPVTVKFRKGFNDPVSYTHLDVYKRQDEACNCNRNVRGRQDNCTENAGGYGFLLCG